MMIFSSTGRSGTNFSASLAKKVVKLINKRVLATLNTVWALAIWRGTSAAMRALPLSSGELDQSVVEREKHILTEQARESGKPEQVIEKMIQGRMKKFLAEVTLLGQDFVINPDLTVEAAAREAGVEIVSYVRMAVGEGIEKVEEDFAAEVAKAAQG